MGKVYLNDVELNNYNEKLKCYKKSQIENMIKIEKYFNEILQYYKTSNNSVINNLNNLDKKNFITIKSNFEKYLLLINNKINLYKRIVSKNSESFNNINKGA